MTTSTTPANPAYAEAAALLAAPKNGADSLRLGQILLTLLRGQTLLALASRLNSTSGVIHHYISVTKLTPELQLALQNDRLNFKEARALTSFPPGRQPDLATPFLASQLSSVHIEKYARTARQNPGWDHRQLTAALLHPPAAEPAPTPTVVPVQAGTQRRGVSHTPTPPLDPDTLLKNILTLAGHLRQLHTQRPPEITRLRISQAARTLSHSLTPWLTEAPK